MSDRFHNLYGKSGAKTPWDILRWKLRTNPYKQAKKRQKTPLKVHKSATPPQTEEDYLIWLGHASFLLQLGGKQILIDPVWGDIPFYKRYCEAPFPLKHLRPDYLFISHGHYDHLDAKTLKQLPSLCALTPKKMSQLLRKINPSFKIQEATWFQKYAIDAPFEIHFLPAHHWHKRTPTDTNKVLWGSFLILYKKIKIYFAADTAYSPHFAKIGQMFGPIDFALLPIGAYEPRWFMKNNHINPQEALKAYHDLNARWLIPMHYGTFDLSDEPLDEPPRLLRQQIQKERVEFLDVGEIFYLKAALDPF